MHFPLSGGPKCKGRLTVFSVEIKTLTKEKLKRKKPKMKNHDEWGMNYHPIFDITRMKIVGCNNIEFVFNHVYRSSSQVS